MNNERVEVFLQCIETTSYLYYQAKFKYKTMKDVMVRLVSVAASIEHIKGTLGKNHLLGVIIKSKNDSFEDLCIRYSWMNSNLYDITDAHREKALQIMHKIRNQVVLGETRNDIYEMFKSAYDSVREMVFDDDEYMLEATARNVTILYYKAKLAYPDFKNIRFDAEEHMIRWMALRTHSEPQRNKYGFEKIKKLLLDTTDKEWDFVCELYVLEFLDAVTDGKICISNFSEKEQKNKIDFVIKGIHDAHGQMKEGKIKISKLDKLMLFEGTM